MIPQADPPAPELVIRQEDIEELVPILEGSVLFDSDWYAHISGGDRPRGAAVEHYLREGRSRGLTPHPLFVSGYCFSIRAAMTFISARARSRLTPSFSRPQARNQW